MSQRDKARAEVARLLAYDEQYTCDSDGTKWFDYESGADRILANFDRLAEMLGYTKTDEPTPCQMTHTPPFDFAQCETHDTTFALGDTCKFDGREMWEVYADEAQEQRGRAVRAEMELERALPWTITTVDELEALTDGTIIEDQGVTATKAGDVWHYRMGVFEPNLPVTVVWMPETDR